MGMFAIARTVLCVMRRQRLHVGRGIALDAVAVMCDIFFVTCGSRFLCTRANFNARFVVAIPYGLTRSHRQRRAFFCFGQKTCIGRAGRVGEQKHLIAIILTHMLRWGYQEHFPGTHATKRKRISSLSLIPVRPF